LFRTISFSLPLAVLALSFFVLYGTQFITAQYLQVTLGLSALQAGLASLPGTVAYLTGSLLAPRITGRVGTARGLSGSLLISAAGYGLLTLVAWGGLWIVVAGFVVFSIGLAGVYVLATDLTVSTAPPERAGATSAILETSANLGGALGIATLGSIVLAASNHADTTSALTQAYQLAELAATAATLIATTTTIVLLRPRSTQKVPSATVL
jgi:DHA2 family multidrug resistance protein-like MFS transporter